LRYLLELPGEVGEDLILDLDTGALLGELAEELGPIHRRPMSRRKLPALSKRTVARKRRKGVANPSQPLVELGKFQRAHEVEVGDGSVKLVVNQFLNIMPRRFRKGYEQLQELGEATDRAIKRWLKGV